MREAIVNYSKLGYSYNRISGNVNKIIPSSILEIFSISKSSVSTTVKKYSKSKNFDSAKRTGRPKNSKRSRHESSGKNDWTEAGNKLHRIGKRDQ